MNFLKKITKEQWQQLRKAGLIKERKTKEGMVVQEPNFRIANKQHKSRAKTYFVVEEPRIINFLEGKKTQKPFFKNKKPRKSPQKA